MAMRLGIAALLFVTAAPDALFDANPQHIWNRVYDALCVRRDQAGNAYGADALDPLLWYNTKYLLTGPSHQGALTVLDEFLRVHAENQIHDPLRRALFQHKLWAVFDWVALPRLGFQPQQRELEARLAEALHRVSLTPEDVKSLPNTYAAAMKSGVLPSQDNFFELRGAWVRLQPAFQPVASVHTYACSGRSGFEVFLNLRQGRKATLDYLQRLWNFPEPWIKSEIDRGDNPKMPQFPAGTQVALVRHMNVFDRDGSLVSTPIIESIQMRVYRTISSRHDENNIVDDWEAARKEQNFVEIRMSPAKLLAGRDGGLRPVTHDDEEFATFQTQGMDVFELPIEQHTVMEPQGRILDRCVGCHSAPGIHSLQTRSLLLKPNRSQVDPANGNDPDRVPYGQWWENADTIDWKQNRYDWGLLNGYWAAGSGSNFEHRQIKAPQMPLLFGPSS